MEIILDYDPVNKWEGCAYLHAPIIAEWLEKNLDCDAVGDGVLTYWTYDRPYTHWFEHYPEDSESTRYAGKIRCSSLAAAKWLLANWKLEAA